MERYSKNNHAFRQSGQALLIVLLSLAVVLTIVLSVLSSTITDVAVTSREEEALRAFSAAEAGVEQALIAGQTGSSTLNNSTFTTTVSAISEGESAFEYPQDLVAGDTGTVWFVAHSDNTGNTVCSEEKPCFTGETLKLCWGRPDTSATTSTTPAIEATIFYLSTPGVLSSAKVARVALDPNSNRVATNSFTQATTSPCTVGGTTYAFQSDVSFSSLGIPASVYGVENGLQHMIVRTFYNSSVEGFGVDVNFAGNTVLPSQGKKIASVGTSGESTRKIEVDNLYRSIPTIFLNSIYSVGGISQ